MKRNILIVLLFLCSSCSTSNSVDFSGVENFYDNKYKKYTSSEIKAYSLDQLYPGTIYEPTCLDNSYQYTDNIESNEFKRINEITVQLKPEFLSNHEQKCTLNIKVECQKEYQEVWSKNYAIVYNYGPKTEYIQDMYEIDFNSQLSTNDLKISAFTKEGPYDYDSTFKYALTKNSELYGLPYCHRKYKRTTSPTEKGYHEYWFFDMSKKMFAWFELNYYVYGGKCIYETGKMKIRKYYFDDNPRFEGLSIGTHYLSTSSSFTTSDGADSTFYVYSCKLNEIFKQYFDNDYVTSIYKGGAVWNY